MRKNPMERFTGAALRAAVCVAGLALILSIGTPRGGQAS